MIAAETSPHAADPTGSFTLQFGHGMIAAETGPSAPTWPRGSAPLIPPLHHNFDCSQPGHGTILEYSQSRSCPVLLTFFLQFGHAMIPAEPSPLPGPAPRTFLLQFGHGMIAAETAGDQAGGSDESVASI